MWLRLIVYPLFFLFLFIAFFRITCQTFVVGYTVKEDIFFELVPEPDCKKVFKLDWNWHSTIYSTIITLNLMTKKDKRVQKIFRNPKNVSFKELDLVLKDFGFEVRQPKSGSSHFIYYKDEFQITVPFKRPFVKEVYIKRIQELVGDLKDEKRP